MTRTAPAPVSLPPPLELRSGGVVTGWIDGDLVRFRGFDSPHGAAHAAAIAHRAMLRRLPPGSRAAPEPLGSVLTSVDGGAGDAAFELRVPPPIDELRMRGMAYVMYRALRSSGVDWPLLRPSARFSASDRPLPSRFAVGAAMRARRARRLVGATARRLKQHITFTSTLAVLALATVTSLVAAPASIAVSVGMLLIGSLIIAANPAARSRMVPARGTHEIAARVRAIEESREEGVRRTRRARDDRVMLLRAGRGYAWR
jgi:hypothetical protein